LSSHECRYVLRLPESLHSSKRLPRLRESSGATLEVRELEFPPWRSIRMIAERDGVPRGFGSREHRIVSAPASFRRNFRDRARRMTHGVWTGLIVAIFSAAFSPGYDSRAFSEWHQDCTCVAGRPPPKATDPFFQSNLAPPVQIILDQGSQLP